MTYRGTPSTFGSSPCKGEQGKGMHSTWVCYAKVNRP